MNHAVLLLPGLIVLIAVNMVLALNVNLLTTVAGVSLRGIHMGITQGLLATMIADTAPPDLCGTAYGFSTWSVV